MSLSVLAPTKTSFESWTKSRLTTAFSTQTSAFLAEFSNQLMTSPSCRQHQELTALGFWLRPANIAHLRSRLSGISKPLGSVIHFTPANVDTMFIYSWVCSLLMGNRNLVRVASQPSTLRECLLNTLNALLEQDKYATIANANVFVGFDKHSDWTERLCSLADARVIWGGDESVSTIRAFSVPPRCRDISFADRYSAAIIDGDALHHESDLDRLAQDLWRDTAPYQQQACSSPKLVYWLGNCQNQLELFSKINTLARNDGVAQSQLNEHLVTSQLLCARDKACSPLLMDAVCVLPVQKVSPSLHTFNQGAGMYFVHQIEAIEHINGLFDNKVQTLSYWGVTREQVVKLLENPSIQGVDRAVPVGQALNFDVEWDGYELLSQLSRKVVID